MSDKCECSGGSASGGGCLCAVILLIWMLFYGGCELPGDIKAIRKSLEQPKAEAQP